MPSQLLPPHVVIDDFLPAQDAEALLEYAIASFPRFARADTVKGGSIYQDEEHRKALSLGDLGPTKPVFCAAVEAHFEDLCRALGLAPFAIAGWDIGMAAHRDGGFFKPHVDTMTEGDRDAALGDRVISLVYYLHRPQARFTGGDLALLPFAGEAEPTRVAPRHNRLVAFPSFACHEVEPVQVPGDGWEDARFSVNCWLLRVRD